ncbi:uncharacterized protein LOC107493249 [Arachis duranensis]|uniref:Uncharacterized protein LOC107493249 n=1 Tax=Arachis duranensis TaxID=130453 RepID=A0A6P4DNT4_ARADU|nr:uncharacterized protein LOC107493249 [Arachis duranensis]
MEQSNGENGSGGRVRSTQLTEDEREVFDILVRLHDMVLEFESEVRIPFQWGRKKKRSAIQPSFFRRFSSSPPPVSNGGGDGGVVAAAVVKGEAPSPATPLSLSLTESDEKPNNILRAKASLKRKREHYLKLIEDLTKSQASLNKEIENVKNFRDRLRAFNSKLKERKLELNNGPKSECKNSSMEIGCEMQQKLGHDAPRNSSNSMGEYQENNKPHELHNLQAPNAPHHIRLRVNNHSEAPQLCSREGINQLPKKLMPMEAPSSSSPNSSLAIVNNNGNSNIVQPVIPDLNAFPEDFVQVDSYQPLDTTAANKDLSRVMAAQARQMRLQKNRLKNSTATKSRYSCR